MTSSLVPLAIPLALLVFDGQTSRYWDWQLTEPFDLSVDVEVLVLDADSVSSEQIETLKARGVKPLCYISVGTWEAYRDDHAEFPPQVLGKPLGDWPDERYLDIRNLDVVVPIIQARMDRCKALGFMGVEADNLDLHHNDTGFVIGIPQVIKYATTLARYAYSIELEIGQKNAPDLAPLLVKYFDFMMVESCFVWDFCGDVQPYIDAGKPVMAAEYVEAKHDWDAVCAQARDIGMHLVIKNKEITAGGYACP